MTENHERMWLALKAMLREEYKNCPEEIYSITDLLVLIEHVEKNVKLGYIFKDNNWRDQID